MPVHPPGGASGYRFEGADSYGKSLAGEVGATNFSVVSPEFRLRQVDAVNLGLVS